MFHSGGGPLSMLIGVLSSVFSVLAAAVLFAIVLVVLALLVRFLWFGTRAAQLYLLRNGDSATFSWPVKPVGGPDTPTSPTPEEHVTGADANPTEANPTDNAAPVPPRSPLKPRSAPPAE
jgi:hypothetical protein